ncbi:MAG: ribosomal protein S18-alanine N-acetyltransferase [Candidatus Solibacter sp.]
MAAIRLGGAEDLKAIAAIQASSAGAATWDVGDYLGQGFLVAEDANQVVGFVIWRAVAADEGEILNLAVAPEFRRRGVARELLEFVFRTFKGDLFLEVRESNAAARYFYKSLCFQEISYRKRYYDLPPETAIVMKFHSC